LPITTCLIILLTLIWCREQKEEQQLTGVSWWLLGFLGWIVFNAWLFSRQLYASFTSALPIFISSLIFLIIQTFQPNKKIINFFIRGFLIGSVGIILFSFYVYLSPKFPSLRMGGPFRQHNAFAGFLTTLLPLSLYTSMFEQKFKLIWPIISTVVLTALILTFSRGGAVAIGGVLIVFLFFLWRQNGRQKFIKPVVIIILLMLTSSALAYGLYKIKTVNFSAVGINVADSPYASEIPEVGETGVNSRFQYWKAALKISGENPITGTGLNTFEQEYRRIQTDPRFFSVDPHNVILKILTELGLVGVIIFTMFLIFLLWPALKSIWQHQSDPVFIPLFIGLIGLLIHYNLDLNLTFPAHYFLFFTLAALLFKPKYESPTLLN